MKEEQLRKHATCSICKNPIGHAGFPGFWTMKLERHLLDMKAIKRQDGLSAMLGSPVLASVMGPDEELTATVVSVELTICEACSLQDHRPAYLAELGEHHEKAH